MLNLPATTILNKPLPKKAIFEKFDLKPAARNKFDGDISKIVIAHEVSSLTTSIAKGCNVDAFFVLVVILKRKHFDEKNIILLSRLINQKMLFVLVYNDSAKLAVYHSKLLQADWLPFDELTIRLSGPNLDAVWENIIAQIGNIEVELGKTLDEQIKLNGDKEKLLQHLETLERRARSEKQPKKKFELVQEIKRLGKNGETRT